MAHAAASTSYAPGCGAAELPSQQPALPATFQRLVARRVGRSFREVAEVEEAPLLLPGPGEVLVQLHYAGINGGCETFRARGEFAFAGARAASERPVAPLRVHTRGLQAVESARC